MKNYTTVTTAEEWINIQTMGTFEYEKGNSEYWSFNGNMYRLNHLDLNLGELSIINDFYSEA